MHPSQQFMLWTFLQPLEQRLRLLHVNSHLNCGFLAAMKTFKFAMNTAGRKRPRNEKCRFMKNKAFASNQKAKWKFFVNHDKFLKMRDIRPTFDGLFVVVVEIKTLSTGPFVPKVGKNCERKAFLHGLCFYQNFVLSSLCITRKIMINK